MVNKTKNPAAVGVFAGAAAPAIVAFGSYSVGFTVDVLRMVGNMPSSDFADNFAYYGALAATIGMTGFNLEHWNSPNQEQRNYSRATALTSTAIGAGIIYFNLG